MPNRSLDSLNQLTGVVIGEAIAIHRLLGPGLQEIAYEEALQCRLLNQGLKVDRQPGLPLRYKGIRLDCGFRLDLVVADVLPLEIKAVEIIHPIHEAQLLTYLRLGGFSLGLLLNFEVAVLKDGIRRKVQTTEWNPPAVATIEFPTDRIDPISSTIIGAAIEVHRQLGPGLLPKTYENCLCYELSTRGIAFQAGLQLPLLVDNVSIDATAEIPILVDSHIPVFPLCAPKILDIHLATATARARQGGWSEALILNFHDHTLRQGIRRVLP